MYQQCSVLGGVSIVNISAQCSMKLTCVWVKLTFVYIWAVQRGPEMPNSGT